METHQWFSFEGGETHHRITLDKFVLIFSCPRTTMKTIKFPEPSFSSCYVRNYLIGLSHNWQWVWYCNMSIYNLGMLISLTLAHSLSSLIHPSAFIQIEVDRANGALLQSWHKHPFCYYSISLGLGLARHHWPAWVYRFGTLAHKSNQKPSCWMFPDIFNNMGKSNLIIIPKNLLPW